MSRGSGIDKRGFFLFFNIINYLAGIPKESKKIKILDFGCGVGKLVNLFSNYGFDAHGCDIEPRWDENQKNLKKINLDPYLLPFSDDTFDFVISSSVMEHVQNKEIAFLEIKRVLKNGGFAVHCFPSKYYLPLEPHTQVPFLNFFLPYIPTAYLYISAFLGFRKLYGGTIQTKNMKIADIVNENKIYCNKYLFYISNSKYEKISIKVFGNFNWRSDLYIKFAISSSIASFARKLPFKYLSGLIIRHSRMALLVNKK